MRQENDGKKYLCDIMRGLFIVVSDDVNCGFPHMKKVASEGSGTYNQVK